MHQPQPDQRYWRRLRKAEYFDDSSGPEEASFALTHAMASNSDDDRDLKGWVGEPGQSDAEQLRTRLDLQLEENKQLKN